MSTLNADMIITARPTKSLEWRIVQAYISLAEARKGADGECKATLMRCGSYAVHLVESAPSGRDHAVPFWLELFDHKTRTSLDSYGSHRLEEVAAAGTVLVAIAESLHEEESRQTGVET
jgi:hypothetical protein